MAGEPIFVGGMYKSGTSLLRAMLGRHSRLYGGLETQWLRATWSDRDGRRQWLDRLAVFYDASPDLLETACGDAASPEAVLDRLMAFLSERAGKQRWIEKTPANVGAIARILGHWPDAQILHIVRDPRDVYASHVEAGKWIAPAEFAARWHETIGAARRWQAQFGESTPAYCEIRYEKLVLDPANEMRRILEFLGETWEPQVADFEGQPEDFDRVRAATGKESSSLKRLAKPLTPERVGLWQRTLRPGQWDAVVREVERFGSGDALRDVAAESGALAVPISTRAQAGTQ